MHPHYHNGGAFAESDAQIPNRDALIWQDVEELLDVILGYIKHKVETEVEEPEAAVEEVEDGDEDDEEAEMPEDLVSAYDDHDDCYDYH